jgi:hypothetical protein
MSFVSFFACVAGNTASSTSFTVQLAPPDQIRPVVSAIKQSKDMSFTVSASDEEEENALCPRERHMASRYALALHFGTGIDDVDKSRCESTQVSTIVALHC